MASTSHPDMEYVSSDDENALPAPLLPDSISFECYFGNERVDYPYRFTIDGPSLKRLTPEGWFNDDLVAFGLSLWYEHVLASKDRHIHARLLGPFFYHRIVVCSGGTGIKLATRLTDFSKLDLIVIPVTKQGHWFAIVVANPSSCIEPNSDQ
ncbi:hypothetical protein M422DRAFT_45913 [Sphaerobolus stellatus SS14]|uniref:Ubiquitin-like protease family profile domain-containing protein n=1 Tax=Sphaerobolus stellatus (strain SS14) TaxID=990650 RepID=A0A0C9VVD8_SPHS4|nr:hypothetical protein M422DRAFT_45913 [Sphaerobolus stellatus SS14]